MGHAQGTAHTGLLPRSPPQSMGRPNMPPGIHPGRPSERPHRSSDAWSPSPGRILGHTRPGGTNGRIYGGYGSAGEAGRNRSRGTTKGARGLPPSGNLLPTAGTPPPQGEDEPPPTPPGEEDPHPPEAEAKETILRPEDPGEARPPSPPAPPTGPEPKKARRFQRGGGRKPAADKAVKSTPQIDLFLRQPRPTALPTTPGHLPPSRCET